MAFGCLVVLASHALDLPHALEQIGIRTLGVSAPKLRALLDNQTIHDVTMLDGVLTLKLMQPPGDDSVARLQNEMKGDRYHIQRLPMAGAVVDVGANLGDMAIAVAKIRPQMQVIAIEPTPLTYFYFRLNMHLNGVRLLQRGAAPAGSEPGGVLPLNAGAGDGSGPAKSTVWYSPRSSQEAVFGDIPEAQQKNMLRAMVPSLDLLGLLERRGIERLRLLKIDCEGCEFRLIPKMGTAGWLLRPPAPPGLLSRLFAPAPLAKVERLEGELHFHMCKALGLELVRPALPQDGLLGSPACSLGRPCDVDSCRCTDIPGYHGVATPPAYVPFGMQTFQFLGARGCPPRAFTVDAPYTWFDLSC